jgi:hypothetical protein
MIVEILEYLLLIVLLSFEAAVIEEIIKEWKQDKKLRGR